MFIIMHCMGMPFNGNTIKEKSLGGSETAAYYVAKELAAQGHKVTLFTASQEEGEFDGVRYLYSGQPNEQQPLGDRFHFYAQGTPSDVMIIQRHPLAFQFPWAAKIKLWWVHDLALARNRGQIQSMLWNIDGILTVSEYHKQQYVEAYGLNPDIVTPITNGIDLSLYEKPIEEPMLKSRGADEFSMLYSSRPERGLEHLVMPNGIMEQLWEKDKRLHLYVCAYDNVTDQMRGYYDYLNKRCEELPNVTRLGALTKQALADAMRACQLLVYPTPGPQSREFNEVSCITAMEAMAAGLPFLSTRRGALPETCEGSGSILISPATAEDGFGLPRISAFVAQIVKVSTDYYRNNAEYSNLVDRQLRAAKAFSWENVGGNIEQVIKKCRDKNRSPAAVLRYMMRMSDFYALRYITQNPEKFNIADNHIINGVKHELETRYGFAINNTWAEHYKNYYQYEADRGVDYGPEPMEGNSRFEFVSQFIGKLPDGVSVLDYGCAHGHYTVNLAKRFPKKNFIGIDIAASNVAKARAWAEKEKLTNINFYEGHVVGNRLEMADGEDSLKFGTEVKLDAIIAAEVLEHLESPAEVSDALGSLLADDGLMIITTPFGPWEAQGYVEYDPWRAHVHHLERQDLHELWGMHPNFKVNVVPAGQSKWGDLLGSYVTTYRKPTALSGAVDYVRKYNECVPYPQTVSGCMIVKDGEKTLRKTLDSIADICDELIIGLDKTTTDATREVIDRFNNARHHLWPAIKVIDIDSPVEIGFDSARNETLKEACGDWIFWIDADEEFINPEGVFKFLHNNQYDGYAIAQHHFAVEPLGVMKTDYPCRFFRANRGVKFYGVVHEHPEVKLNASVGHVASMPGVHIAHGGYTTEVIRKKRFDRNIDLLVRDRETYPDRKLGKFLWLRDLSQMCKYEMEINGGQVTPAIVERAREGIALWEELLAAGEIRMLVDGMQFYSMCARLIGGGFEFGFKVDSSKMNGGLHLDTAQPVQAYFLNKEHAEKMIQAVIDERLKGYDTPYF